jgi:hypothetical protein
MSADVVTSCASLISALEHADYLFLESSLCIPKSCHSAVYDFD